MLFKLLAVAVLTTALCAQTAVEQLQKGIYAQDTAGDLDRAIAIYRQVIGSGQTPRVVAATAQYRLTQALLQKGEPESPPPEAQKLALNYAEYRELIMGLARRLTTTSLAQRASRGRASDYQHYHHNRTGVDLTAPFGTSFTGDYDSSDDGDMVIFGGHQYAVWVWLKPANSTIGELDALLRNDLAVKPSMRTDFPGWKARADIQMDAIGNGRTLSAVADYTDNGRKMVEVMTWYRTPKTHVFFFARVPAEMELDVRGYMSKMVSVAVIP
jgi:hypothetical protein